MKRAIIVLVVVLLTAGFVRGWFAMTGPHREKDGSKVEVNLTVDPDKMKEDAEQVKESAEKIEEKVVEEFKDATRKVEQHPLPVAPDSE